MRVVTGSMLLALLTACPGTDQAPAPIPSQVVVLAGDGVSGAAGDEIDVAVRVLDGQGQPMAGVPVSFVVVSGSGAVPSGAMPSDAGGVARARWRLGAELGSNGLLASLAGGVVSVRLTATGVPGPVTRIEKVGDRQSAAAGSVVTMAYRLFDRLGHRAPGAAATCTVDAGGGSATPGPSPGPDSDGACAWTLGPAPRVENRLTVRAGTAAPAAFTAWSGVPSPLAARTSDLLKGSRTGVRRSPFGIDWAIVVDSAFEIASVTARVGGLTTPLAKGTSVFDAQAWVGSTPGDTLTRGTVVARITAVDVRGTEGDLFLWFDLDRLPVLTITTPIDLSLARAEVAVSASCADDDPAGCTSLTASLGGGTVQPLGGTSSVAGTFSLSGLQPGAVAVTFAARDSAGQVVSATRTVWLEPSASLALVGAAPGAVLDATSTTAFFVVPGAIGLADLATGDATTTPFAGQVQAGSVWPSGAAFVAAPSLDEAWSWVPGAEPVSSGPMADGSPLQVAGRFALVTRMGPGPGETTLVRTDLDSGAAVVVAPPRSEGALAASGEVVFVSGVDHDLWRYRDGPTPLEPLTRDGLARGRPRTDGVTALYWKQVGATDLRAVLWDGADQPLGPVTCLVEPCLALDGAWAAFFQPGPSGLGQLWRSGPGGLEQVTFFDQPSTLEGLTPDGVVILRSGARRYRSAPGALDPQPVSGIDGRVVVRDGKALVLLGRSVLEIVP